MPEPPDAPESAAEPLHYRRPWRKDFLTQYERTGRLYHVLQALGISKAKFDREVTRDPKFARAVEIRRQRYADTLEDQFDKMFKTNARGNVVAGIVLAKKHRPHDFIERHAGVTMQVDAVATMEQARALLQAMLHDATPELQARLLVAGPTEHGPDEQHDDDPPDDGPGVHAMPPALET